MSLMCKSEIQLETKWKQWQDFKYVSYSPAGDMLTHINEPFNKYSLAYDYASVRDNPSL